MPAYTLTPADLAALRIFAGQYGRTWKSKLRARWSSPGGLTGPFAQILLYLRNVWGPAGLEKFRLPELSAAELSAAPALIPLVIHADARRIVLEDLAAGIDLRSAHHEELLRRISLGRAEVLGNEPGPALDRAQELWVRCYRHLMTTLREPAVL